MKAISSGLTAHIESETTTLCTLWKLTRRDGEILGFTDHDTDVVYGGLTYAAATGYTRSAVSANATLAVDNLDIEGILASGALTGDEIRAGIYDWCELLVSLVNYADLTMGDVILRRGTLGEFTLKAGAFVTELRGISQALSRNFLRVYTADCTADLGDARCKVILTGYTDTGAVSAISTQRRIFTASITGGRAAGFYDGGLLSWTSGPNAGAKQEVKTVAGSTVTLYLPSGADIAASDAFTIRAGCDKTTAICHGKFNNIVNNRSFPFIPGRDRVLRTPDAKPQ
jgi:uncharacterized phage protein (TIGR02218 family)